MKQIDERGNACPIPVVHTKESIRINGWRDKINRSGR